MMEAIDGGGGSDKPRQHVARRIEAAAARAARARRAQRTRRAPPPPSSEEYRQSAIEAATALAEAALRIIAELRAGEEEGRAVVKARNASNGAPFASIAELALRAELPSRGIEALAGADAFAALGLGRHEAAWEARAVDPGLTGELPLFRQAAKADHPEVRPLIADQEPTLPAMKEGEAIALDYISAGLTLRRHPLALLRPILQRLRCDDSRTLARASAGRRVRVPGLVLMRQQPMTAKGVIFVTIEDEHGQANVVVYAHVSQRDRVPLLTSRLLLVEGRVEREDEHAEVPIIHLIAARLIDRSDLLDILPTTDGQDAEPSRADGSPAVRMPPTRDFRQETGNPPGARPGKQRAGRS